MTATLVPQAGGAIEPAESARFDLDKYLQALTTLTRSGVPVGSCRSSA